MVSSGLRCEISQFWQFRQRSPQPDVAIENAACAWQKVQQRLLLDRVDVERTRVGVGQRVELAVLVDAVAAVSAIFRLQQALVGTQLALDVLAQFQVMPRFPDPAATLPELPNLLAGGVVFEDVDRNRRSRSLHDVVCGRAAARGTREARHAVFQDLSAGGPPRHFSLRFLIHPHLRMAKYVVIEACTTKRDYQWPVEDAMDLQCRLKVHPMAEAQHAAKRKPVPMYIIISGNSNQPLSRASFSK